MLNKAIKYEVTHHRKDSLYKSTKNEHSTKQDAAKCRHHREQHSRNEIKSQRATEPSEKRESFSNNTQKDSCSVNGFIHILDNCHSPTHFIPVQSPQMVLFKMTIEFKTPRGITSGNSIFHQMPTNNPKLKQFQITK